MKYKHINFKPTESMAKAAKRGLDMRDSQPDSNKGMTSVGLARARQLIARETLSPETVKRMHSFFSRHEVDKSSASWKKGNSKGEQAWLGWGGDSGQTWATKIVRQMDAADKKGNSMRLNLVSNIVINQNTSERIIRGKKHIIVHGVTHMIADTVMNGIYYPREEVEILCNSLENLNVIMPAEHPEDDEGNFLSATSPLALVSNNVGAFAFNFSMRGDQLISDMAICPDIAMMNEHGESILNTIEEKKAMDMSTGFYLTTENSNGVAPDGNEYGKLARNLKMDHSAILPISPGAKQSNEGVGMFANSALDSDGQTVEMETFITNMAASQFNLPLSSEDATDWLERKAIEEIKEFTKSGDKPSSNYRKFFAHFDRDNADDYESYYYPFARVIDGRPMANPKALEEIRAALIEGKIPDSEKESVQSLVDAYDSKKGQANSSSNEVGFLSKLMNLLKRENLIPNGYNTNDSGDVAANNKDEDTQMRKTMMSRMMKNGGYKQEELDEMSDEKLMNAYEGMMKKANDDMGDDKKKKENGSDMDDKGKKDNAADAKDSPSFDEKRDHPQGKANSQAPEWAKDLLDRVKKMETSMNKQTDTEIEQLAEAVANHQGISKDQAKLIPIETLRQLAANSGVVNFNTGSTTTAANASSGIGSEFDNMEAPE